MQEPLLPVLNVDQVAPMPDMARPIAIIGAGAIVRHAHMPAYRLAGFPVIAVFDTRTEVAEKLAEDFGIGSVADSIAELVRMGSAQDAVFDLATPAISISGILTAFPDNAAVLIQKPMGENLAQAEDILSICREKHLTAAVNFQLRYAPYVLAAKKLIEQGAIGEILDIDVKVNVHMPWEQWDFLEMAPRMELVYHSIHYLDLIRDLMGEPRSVYSKAIKHPLSPKLESSRSATILDYGDWKRATVHTYHGHVWGPRHQESYVKIEGSEGCIKFQMGLNMNYPEGAEDWLEVSTKGHWRRVPLAGSWFPNAFIGTMASVMRATESKSEPPTSVEDAIKTMRLVEKAYESSDRGGVPL